MSYPADGLPRFKPVAIGAGADGDAPIGYVYDRAFCHLPVCAIPARTRAVALARATSIAAALELDPSAPVGKLVRKACRPGPLPPGDPRHGTITAYKKRGCKCDKCRETGRAYDRERKRRKRAAS